MVLHDYLLVEVINEDTGVISSADPTYVERPQKGKVLELGDGFDIDHGKVFPMKVKVGDTVTWMRGADADTDDDTKKAGLAYVRYSRLMYYQRAS
jgi:co-chaperonin GroES (HSP10)